MKLKFLQLITLAATASIFSACNKDEISELQDTNGAILADQETINKTLDDVGFEDRITGYIKGNRKVDSVAFENTFDYQIRQLSKFDDSYFFNNGDGTYEIYIFRTGSLLPAFAYDLSKDNYAYAELYIESYNPNLGISSMDEVEFEIYDFFEQDDIEPMLEFGLNGYLNSNGYVTTMTFDSFSFDPVSGQCSFELTVHDDEDAGGNTYNSTENLAEVKAYFSGKLVSGSSVNRKGE